MIRFRIVLNHNVVIYPVPLNFGVNIPSSELGDEVRTFVSLLARKPNFLVLVVHY